MLNRIRICAQMAQQLVGLMERCACKWAKEKVRRLFVIAPVVHPPGFAARREWRVSGANCETVVVFRLFHLHKRDIGAPLVPLAVAFFRHPSPLPLQKSPNRHYSSA